MLIAHILLGIFFVGVFTLIWTIVYSWFADNRAQNDMYYAGARSTTSWNTDHEFFDMITEYQNDFA